MNDEKNELEYYDDDELLDEEQNEEETEDSKKDRVIQNPFVFLLLCLLMFSLPVLWLLTMTVLPPFNLLIKKGE